MSIDVRSIGKLSSVGLRLPAGLSFDEWKNVGVELAKVGSATQWAIGDWLFYGEWEYGRQYEEALELTGLDYQTLRDLKWVAGRFDMSFRKDNLSIAHHKAVAALPPAEAQEWLTRADEGSWTTARLREEVASKFADAARARVSRPQPTAADEPDDEPEHTKILFDLDPIRSAAWHAAADRQNMTIAAWMIVVCDQAAA